MTCIFLWSSAVRVHDSKTYRKMDVTRERISRILELREILPSFQTGFKLVNAAVACAILDSISSLEHSSVITEPRYLKLVTISGFCPFIFLSLCWCHWCCLSSAWSSWHWSPCRRLWRLYRDSTYFASSSSFPAKPSIFISKAEIGDCSAFNADSAFVMF